MTRLLWSSGRRLAAEAARAGGPLGPPGPLGPIGPAARAGYDALRQHGLYPINHLVVVKDSLLAAHPGLAEDLFAAYAAAKNQYVARLRAGGVTTQIARAHNDANVLIIGAKIVSSGPRSSRPRWPR